ncbi:MAG: hypothetical protein NTW21_02365 [Verrucomicrobia bacterium]|nr:hypothetical protein [Verrucomicrobiota bacterium]
MKTQAIAICLILEMIGAVSAAEPQVTHAPVTPGNVKDIKAYCLDFNWAATNRKRKPFAAPGTWAGADPAQHVAWYKAMGANVIQTFGVSTNGYACMYKEADWLMNESGDKKSIDAVKAMIGPHTRLITCLARWNGQDATKVVPEALAAGIGLYGFTVPRNDGGLVPLDEILSRPVGELKGDDRNIAVLARAFHGASIDSVRNDKGGFTEPGK